MLTGKIQEALNRQINAETHSAYLYLSMAAWFEARNLPGFANWMKVQVQEENLHMTRFFSYVLQRQGRVTLAAIEGPQTDFETVTAVFEAAYKHEVHVTSLIHNLVGLAREERDFATESFLLWFVNEQVEEEAAADAIVQQLHMVKGEGPGLFMLDRELAARVFTPPVATAQP
jgi:ferritin